MFKAPLIDSHCHLHLLDLNAFDNNLDKVIEQAQENGVKQMLCVCTEIADIEKLHHIVDNYKNIYISVGIHPNVKDEDLTLTQLIKEAKHKACIAIGETGLDYYRIDTKEEKIKQKQRFINHINAAISTHKPLIIHTREAQIDTIDILQQENAANIGGVMHCFTETYEMAKKALDLNFYISISGIVTFKNAQIIQEVASKIPLERLLIETDSPFLAPVPFRGKQNHPALVAYVAKMIADLRAISYEEVAAQTTKNFFDCFNINHKKEACI